MDLTVLTALGNLADQQFGQVTRRQAAAVGARIDELVDAGFAEPVAGAVFRLRAGGRSNYPRLYAAWLELAPAVLAEERSPPLDGVVSHDSALRLYRVAGQPGSAAEFTVPEAGAPMVESSPTAVMHVAELAEHEWTQVAGMPVTRPARTLLDLSARYDIDELARMAASLVNQQWITEQDLRRTLADGLARRPQSGDPERWIADVLAEVRP